MPKTQSIEKKETLKKLGAELIEVEQYHIQILIIILNNQKKLLMNYLKLIIMELFGKSI